MVKNGAGMNLASMDTIVSNNNVSDNFWVGIIVVTNSTGCNIHHNTASRNGLTTIGSGIEMYAGSDYNTLDWNVCAGNGNYGIIFDTGATNATGNIYSFNRTLKNTNGGIYQGVGNVDAGFNADSP